MSKKRRSSRSKKRSRKLKQKVSNFSSSIGLSPFKIVLSLLLMVGIGFVIYWAALPGNDDEIKVAATPSQTRRDMEELSVTKQLNEMLAKRFSMADGFLMAINEINLQDERLDKIESTSALTNQQKLLAEQVRLRNKSQVVAILLRNNADCDAEKEDLKEYCLARVESPDQQLAEVAKFWLAFVPAIEFSKNPSDESIRAFADAAREYSGGYLNSGKNAGAFTKVISIAGKPGSSTIGYAKQAWGILAEQMEGSRDPGVLETAKQLRGLALFGEFDLANLGHRILWSDPIASENLAAAIEALRENPNTDLSNWVTLIRAYENYLSTDKVEETGDAWQKVWQISESVPDSAARETLQNILKRQRARAMAIGAPFDLTGTVVPGDKPFGPDQSSYTAVIFCNKERGSIDALLKLGKSSKANQIRYRSILAFEKELTKADLDSLHMIPKEISVASDATARKYLESFPADFFPYVLLIDKKGHVAAANLDIDQLPNRIARFEAKERKALSARATTNPAGKVSQ